MTADYLTWTTFGSGDLIRLGDLGQMVGLVDSATWVGLSNNKRKLSMLKYTLEQGCLRNEKLWSNRCASLACPVVSQHCSGGSEIARSCRRESPDGRVTLRRLRLSRLYASTGIEIQSVPGTSAVCHSIPITTLRFIRAYPPHEVYRPIASAVSLSKQSTTRDVVKKIEWPVSSAVNKLCTPIGAVRHRSHLRFSD